MMTSELCEIHNCSELFHMASTELTLNYNDIIEKSGNSTMKPLFDKGFFGSWENVLLKDYLTFKNGRRGVL